MGRKTRQNKAPNCNSSCKCSLHTFCLEKYETTVSHTYNVNTSHAFKKSSLKSLKDKGAFGPRATYVCDLCLRHGEYLLTGVEASDADAAYADVEMASDTEEYEFIDDSEGDDKEVLDLLDILIHKLTNSNNFSCPVKEKICSLVSVIGKRLVGDKMVVEYDTLQRFYKDTTYMQKLNPRDFLKERNEVLLAFIRSIAPSKDPDSFQLAMIVESVYHLRNSNLILPHSFLANLIQTFISGSKTVTAVNGKLLAGGSDTTYRTWLKENAVEIEMPSEDSDVFVDNVGHYVVKSYRVSQEKNAKPNVVTASINIPWNGENVDLQQKEEFKPGKWGADVSENVIQDKMKDVIKKATEQFLFHEYRYIVEMFKLFDKNHKYFRDQIDAEVARLDSTLWRKCESCSEENNNRKRKCDRCGGKVSKVTSESLIADVSIVLPKYFNVGQKLIPNHAHITMGDVIPVNPNSYENMEMIMKELHKSLIKNGKKKWISIGADGPPYTLMRRLIEESGYDWVTLTSGLGHLNMNQLKTFFAVAKYICFETLGKDVLNFKTIKAFDYFISCKDTHKSWESFEIFLHGTAFEFIRMYMEQQQNPTPHGFLLWKQKVEGPTQPHTATQRFLLDFTFKIAFSIYVQRIGDRSNDAEVSRAGRMTFFGMFYAFNHPVYREVEYSELRNHVISPETVKYSRNRNHTFTESSGTYQKHQGGDFMLEQRVKRMKMLSPKGVMTTEMWERVARNVDPVGKVVKNGMSMLSLREDDQYAIRHTPIEKEMIKWIACLRQSQYLYAASEFVVDIEGNILNAELKDFMENIDEYRNQYFEMALENNLQNIRYTNMNVTSDDIMEEIQPYRFESEEESFSVEIAEDV